MFSSFSTDDCCSLGGFVYYTLYISKITVQKRSRFSFRNRYCVRERASHDRQTQLTNKQQSETKKGKPTDLRKKRKTYKLQEFAVFNTTLN